MDVTGPEAEDMARILSDALVSPDDAHKQLVEIALAFGEHSWETCVKFGENGSIENDCSCGWGHTHYYLRLMQREWSESK